MRLEGRGTPIQLCVRCRFNAPDVLAAVALQCRKPKREESAMARIVLGMGTSHTPMLNAPPEDWPRFYERDSRRTNLLDVDGNLTTYEVQLKRAPADIDAQIAPE